MNKSKLIIPAVLAALALGGCKTSEANYRAAYEKAVAGRDAENDIENTIYGANRRSMGSKTIALPDSTTLEVHNIGVRVTKDGGGIRETLHRYSIVAGQFKQLFNAKSLRERLLDAGYPGAFIVETSEPYYYVIATSVDSPQEAAAALQKIKKDAPIPMKEPLPFILAR